MSSPRSVPKRKLSLDGILERTKSTVSVRMPGSSLKGSDSASSSAKYSSSKSNSGPNSSSKFGSNSSSRSNSRSGGVVSGSGGAAIGSSGSASSSASSRARSVGSGASGIAGFKERLADASLRLSDSDKGVYRLLGFIMARKILLLSVVVLLVVSVAGVWGFRAKNIKNNQSSASSQGGEDGAVTYQTVLPAGKSVDDLGGWQRVSPPDGDPVYAYTDTIDGVSVTVSQQPMPRSIKEGPDQWVADLAKKFNATNRILADGNPVYVGTSAKGPQSAVFRKDDLLILIKSESIVEDQSWATYARSLN